MVDLTMVSTVAKNKSTFIVGLYGCVDRVLTCTGLLAPEYQNAIISARDVCDRTGTWAEYHRSKIGIQWTWSFKQIVLSNWWRPAVNEGRKRVKSHVLLWYERVRHHRPAIQGNEAPVVRIDLSFYQRVPHYFSPIVGVVKKFLVLPSVANVKWEIPPPARCVFFKASRISRLSAVEHVREQRIRRPYSREYAVIQCTLLRRTRGSKNQGKEYERYTTHNILPLLPMYKTLSKDARPILNSTSKPPLQSCEWGFLPVS